MTKLLRWTFAALLSVAVCAPGAPARAVPREIVLLRHGEKQDAFALCGIGVQRSLALKAVYLGKGASQSLFARGEDPAGFFAVTLHSLEVISPSAATWNLPVTNYSVVPLKHVDGWNEEQELDDRTRQAAGDIMSNPQWNGKTVVLAWEHRHIANAKLAKKDDSAVTLRQLLHLDRLGKQVPPTWSGSNYDYFWIVRYKNGSPDPSSIRIVKQTFGGAFAALPQNDWGQPDNLPEQSGCE